MQPTGGKSRRSSHPVGRDGGAWWLMERMGAYVGFVRSSARAVRYRMPLPLSGRACSIKQNTD
ncbi:formate hydrogen lyase subunit alpha [Anopheles sinensis]|uniref:Formate hydrogen lyase subunit alpha n=1 Tax=Anopheles sinensis TaxID=74873 RepID=A0A084WLI2_ANOSI|nr:formate hydrogen lyase subunit alpha [Anopheles sinensis]